MRKLCTTGEMEGREREEKEQGDEEEEEQDWMQKSSSGRRIDEMHFPE